MKHLLFIIFLLSTFALQASIEPIITTLSNKSIKIAFDQSTSTELVVRLRDENGKTFYSDTFHATLEEDKILNLENLPNGNYTLAIESYQLVTESNILISQEHAIASDTDTTYKPQIKVSENRVSLNALSLGKEVSATLISQDDNELLLNESYEDKSSVNKVYDISELPKGNYTMIIKVGEHVNCQNLSL